jgi:uncharacterized integral membrane protein
MLRVLRDRPYPAQAHIESPHVTELPAPRGSRTRTSRAWFGVWIAVAALVVLIVFMLQNTRSVEITFLWMYGSVPLALALLIAGVGAAILAMKVDATRISQLRRARSTR